MPPNNREVELSTWLKASKMSCCLSAGNPASGVGHPEPQDNLVVSSRLGQDLDDELAAIGELDGVAHEVDDHLDRAQGIADHA